MLSPELLALIDRVIRAEHRTLWTLETRVRDHERISEYPTADTQRHGHLVRQVATAKIMSVCFFNCLVGLNNGWNSMNFTKQKESCKHEP